MHSKATQEGGGNIWKASAYNVGGFVLTLDDIEHGILRGNRPHPASTSEQHFPKGSICFFLKPRLYGFRLIQVTKNYYVI